MLDWIFGLVAALAWAISAPVVDTGMKEIKKAESKEAPLIGLLVALVVGLIVLSPIFFLDSGQTYGNSFDVVWAGIFTFPVGTFLYYFAIGRMTAKRAVPVANVKPIFSVFLAALILGEALTRNILASLILIIFGLFFIRISAGGVKREINALEEHGTFLFVFLSVPLAWALGEVSMGAALSPSDNSILATFMALLFATVIYIIVLLVFRREDLKRMHLAPGLKWFAVHGFLSFGIGYTALFTSIAYIGVAKTALITGAWPLLAIPTSIIGEKLRGESIEHRNLRWIALGASLIFAGALINLVGLS
jgi:drug/metabolite transporter (DMT)-like permease